MGNLSHVSMVVALAHSKRSMRLKRKSPADQKSAKNVKKPRKAEVNYLPPYPAGEDEESQEQERIQLLTEVRKRDKNKLIKEKMAKTFAR